MSVADQPIWTWGDPGKLQILRWSVAHVGGQPGQQLLQTTLVPGGPIDVRGADQVSLTFNNRKTSGVGAAAVDCQLRLWWQPNVFVMPDPSPSFPFPNGLRGYDCTPQVTTLAAGETAYDLAVNNWRIQANTGESWVPAQFQSTNLLVDVKGPNLYVLLAAIGAPPADQQVDVLINLVTRK